MKKENKPAACVILVRYWDKPGWYAYCNDNKFRSMPVTFGTEGGSIKLFKSKAGSTKVQNLISERMGDKLERNKVLYFYSGEEIDLTDYYRPTQAYKPKAPVLS